MGKKIKYDCSKMGCYIDGKLGRKRFRAELSRMVMPFNKKISAKLLCKAPYDEDDEYDAIDILDFHTADGLLWTIYEGDLILEYDR